MLNTVTNPIATVRLDSGFSIALDDETRHYFGGYYHVKIVAHCTVPLDVRYFDDELQYEDARTRLGETVRFERVLEKMAVPEEEIDSVRNQLIEAFKNTALGYLSAPDFDRRLVRNEYRISCSKSPKARFKGL